MLCNDELIGVVIGNGTNNRTIDYNYYFKPKAETNYIQLRQVDYDRNFYLSDIIFVKSPLENREVIEISITGQLNNNYRFEVRDGNLFMILKQ